jgi:hypothetical protein
MTLNTWWDSIGGDLSARLRHALKYYRLDGLSLTAVLVLLARKVPLQPARSNRGMYGSYAIDTPDLSFQFRVTETTPGANGPLPFPNVVITRCTHIAPVTSA